MLLQGEYATKPLKIHVLPGWLAVTAVAGSNPELLVYPTDREEALRPMSYRHIFGPVPSRRLGLSLGVDLMPHKTCTLDCVYCECGETTHLTITPEEYLPTSEIREELEVFLSTEPVLDHITFSGSGEPTLHSGIGEITAFIKSSFPRYKIALLTNGSLLYREDVRSRLLAIDVVVVSVDAATSEGFRQVNRPHPMLTLSEIEAGLIAFRREYKHALWAEVFLVPGCNDSEEELAPIKELLLRFRPDRIQVNTLDRPGAQSWVKPLDKAGLERAASFLQSAELITSPQGGRRVQGDGEDLTDRILLSVGRRPLTAEDISCMLGIEEERVLMLVEEMIQKKAIRKVPMPRGIFYTAE